MQRDNVRRFPAPGHRVPVIVDPGQLAGRVPPHDLDAEAAGLSAGLLDASALAKLLDVLRAEDHYSEANARIFQAMRELSTAGVPVDLVSVRSWLDERKWLERTGGSAYLAQLADATPVVGHVAAHARIVRNKWRLRQLIATCWKVLAEAYGDVGDLDAFIASVESAVRELAAARVEDLDRFAAGAIAESSAKAIVAAQAQTRGAWVDTGIESMDEITGLYPNEVTLLGGQPGAGKTSLARWLADRTARRPRRLWDGRADCDRCSCEAPCSEEHAEQKRGVLALALEGSREDWTDYLAAKAAGLDLAGKQNATWSAADYTRFLQELAALRRVPIAIDDRKDLCRANIGPRVRAWREWFERKGALLEVVMLDYFQLGRWEREGQSRENDLNEAGRHLLTLATDSESDLRGLAWLVVVALNSEENVRECSVLQYHCDAWWKLYKGKKRGDETGVRLFIPKQRRRAGDVGCSFWMRPTRGTFSD